MDWIMRLWLFLCFIGVLIPVIQSKKGDTVSWRELYFFVLGAFMGGMPLLYMNIK